MCFYLSQLFVFLCTFSGISSVRDSLYQSFAFLYRNQHKNQNFALRPIIMLRLCRRLLLTDRESLKRPSLIGDIAGSFNTTKKTKVSPYVMSKIRMQVQRQWQRDHKIGRTHNFALCKRCGITCAMANFDMLPTPRGGLGTQCRGDTYDHHEFIAINEAEYDKMKDVPEQKRLTWFRFDRENEE